MSTNAQRQARHRQKIHERLRALENENAALKAENARLRAMNVQGPASRLDAHVEIPMALRGADEEYVEETIERMDYVLDRP